MASRLIALSLVAVAAPAWAQDADPLISPTTPMERQLLERLERQDAEIKALRDQLGEVSKVLGTRVSAVEASTETGKVVMSVPSPRFESASGNFSLAVVGSLQPQVAFYTQSDRGAGAPMLNNGTSFRRAHFGVQGTAFGDFGYTVVFDGAALGGLASAVRDATISYAGLRPFTLIVGNQKPQAGLEPLFSDRSNAATFLEPGLPAQLATVNGTRAIGARIATGNDRYSATIGVFGDDIANAGIANPVAEGWGYHGRVTIAPVNTPTRLVHLGASAFRRDPGTGRATTAATDPVQSQLRYRAQPEITVDANQLIDTGLLTRATRYTYLGLEAASVFGPVSIQGEYAKTWVEQDAGRVDLEFNGAYVLGSVFLTGESRVYDGRTGVFTRLRPRRGFDLGGGPGAIEVAARWSELDLDSRANQLAAGGIRGGRLTDYSLALNWYLNAYLRVQTNYIHAKSERRSATNVDLGTRADIVAIRVQQEW